MKRIAEITAFVNRFRANATKSRQAQSRLKMLRAHGAHRAGACRQPVRVRIRKAAENAAAAADGRGRRLRLRRHAGIVSGINVSIGPQDRIALLGPNGAGKSTLTKLLAGESAALAGATHRGRRISASATSRNSRLEQLRPDCDAFWHVRNLGGADYAAGEEQRVRDHLGRFGFQGDRAFEPVARFSGGEKARLTLALLVARRPNLLLLDEPTNHLDIDMRQALTVALQSFEGGLVVVSHDRHLIKSVADTLWLVADGKLQDFDGDLDDYQHWLRGHGDGASAGIAAKAAPAPRSSKAGAPRNNAPPERKAVRRDPKAKLRRQLEQIEARIAAVAAERALMEAELAADPLEPKLAMRRANLQRDAAFLESQWMEIGTAIEAAEAAESERRPQAPAT